MKQPSTFHPQTVILNFGNGSWDQAGTPVADQSSAASFRETAVFDPHRAAAFVNAMYPRDVDLIAHFGICEKTIGYWRSGERAPRAHLRTLAERHHGAELRRYMHGGDVVGGKLRF